MLQANFVDGWFVGFTHVDNTFAKLEAELRVEESERIWQAKNILNLKLKKKNRIARQNRALTCIARCNKVS